MRSLFFSIFFALNFSAYSMQTEENPFGLDDEPIAIQYFRASISDPHYKEWMSGTLVAPDHIYDRFFDIHISFLNDWHATARKLYYFLLEEGFLRTVGIVDTKAFFNSQTLNKEQQNIKKFLRDSIPLDAVITDDAENTFLLNKGISASAFSRSRTGIFFRDGASINPSPLMQFSNESEGLLKRVLEINSQIEERILALEKLINSDDISPEDIINRLIESPLTPRTFAAKLKLIKDEFSNTKALAGHLKKIVSQDREAIQTRAHALKNIYASPIDVMLLYCYYLFDDVNNQVTTGLTSQSHGGWTLRLLESFGDEEDLSISRLLQTHAQDVLEQLGFFLLSKKIESKHKAHTKKKKSPPKNQKKKLKGKGKNKDKTQALVDDENVSTQSPNNAPVKIKWLTATTKNSLIKLALSKGHRLLDTIARLIAKELALLDMPAGSLSVALVVDTLGRDQLVVSTKRVVPSSVVIKALKNAYEKSVLLSEEILDKNSFMRAEKAQFNKKLGHKSSKDHRSNVDKIKLIKAMKKTPRNALERRLQKFLLTDDQNFNVLPLSNPFWFHSEINLVDYLREQNAPLGNLPAPNNTPYQYIGGSLNTCGKCNAIFRGDDGVVGINERPMLSKMLIFTRAFYNCGYPGYVVPSWSVELNRSRSNLDSALEQCTIPSTKFEDSDLAKAEAASLSSSDD